MRAAEDDAASCIDAVAHTAIVLRSRCRRGAARAERSADSRQYAGHRRVPCFYVGWPTVGAGGSSSGAGKRRLVHLRGINILRINDCPQITDEALEQLHCASLIQRY